MVSDILSILKSALSIVTDRFVRSPEQKVRDDLEAKIKDRLKNAVDRKKAFEELKKGNTGAVEKLISARLRSRKP